MNYVCEKAVILDIDKPTNIYLHYSFFETSDFIFAKGQNFEDIFKKRAYLSDNHECYPVKTLGDEQSVRRKLGLPYDDNLENPETTRVPCGLKASLFEFIGELDIRQEDETPVALNKERLVDQVYLNAVRKKTPQDSNAIFTRADFLSWYLPQVPGFGTRLFFAQADEGLKGKFIFSFNKSNSLLT